MYTIGDFANLGRVSVRMLRHYDAIGLLPPAQIDAANGYRWYSAMQLQRLNRIVVLKDLGFTLQQVQRIVDDTVTAEELRGMLRLRRAELELQINADAERLARVEARLLTIESEHTMAHDVIIKQIPPARVAEVTAIAASFDPQDIGPVIQPMYPLLEGLLAATKQQVEGPGIAYYDQLPADAGVRIHAALFTGDHEVDVEGVDVAILPGIEAATIVHHGPMEQIEPAYQALLRWIDGEGLRAVGLARELYLDCPMDRPQDWVTELQIEIAR